MKKFFVYVMKSQKDGRFYKGMTNNLERRIYEHNKGKHKSTRPFCPWILVYHEEYNSREEARKRELYLKSGSGREFIRNILAP